MALPQALEPLPLPGWGQIGVVDVQSTLSFLRCQHPKRLAINPSSKNGLSKAELVVVSPALLSPWLIETRCDTNTRANTHGHTHTHTELWMHFSHAQQCSRFSCSCCDRARSTTLWSYAPVEIRCKPTSLTQGIHLQCVRSKYCSLLRAGPFIMKMPCQRDFATNTCPRLHKPLSETVAPETEAGCIFGTIR